LLATPDASKTASGAVVPVVLCAYARADLLKRTLDALRLNKVPLIYAFSDGPKTPAAAPAVEEVRALLRAIDWCEVRLTERPTNLGLGRSILSSVTEVLERHESVIVMEDDLLLAPGGYDYLCAALRRYKDDPRVMSVTGWTHASVTPPGVVDAPYFDGRTECWCWGTWARAWKGMDRDAVSLMADCRARGIDVYSYGADLVEMAGRELAANIWAVRFIYLHIVQGGLCFRPPRTMVEHIGFDERASNASAVNQWAAPSPGPCPPLPAQWPEPAVDPSLPGLWRAATGERPRPFDPAVRMVKRLVRRLLPQRP
jgi:hypothetical protein